LGMDELEVGGDLVYGGSLAVSNSGTRALNKGNAFKLFSATSYSGQFSSIALPPLTAGLGWTNLLLVNGSIAVIDAPTPRIENFSLMGANPTFAVSHGSPGASWTLLSSTNLTLPPDQWSTDQSGLFDWLGNATITNLTHPTESQRYFRIKSP